MRCRVTPIRMRSYRRTALGNKSDGKSSKKPVKPSAKDATRAIALYMDNDKDHCPHCSRRSAAPIRLAETWTTQAPEGTNEKDCEEGMCDVGGIARPPTRTQKRSLKSTTAEQS